VTHRRYSLSKAHVAGSHRSGSVTLVIGHFFSGDSCTGLRGRRIGEGFTRGAGTEQKRNQQNQNACQCGLFDHRPETYVRLILDANRATREGGHRSRLQFQQWATQFRSQSGQSSFPNRRREHMTDVRSALRSMSGVLQCLPLQRLPRVRRHKRKAATRLPTRESHTMEHVYSRSRTY
jgi:hypothetical protein